MPTMKPESSITLPLDKPADLNRLMGIRGDHIKKKDYGEFAFLIFLQHLLAVNVVALAGISIVSVSSPETD